MMKISIVTPVYNAAKYIRRTMDSIHGQKGDFELEHIVCDGRSTDGTLEILKEYPAATVISREYRRRIAPGGWRRSALRA